MFEAMLADVLTRVLGQYVSGIDRDSVSLGVWRGCLELHNLTLRADALAVLCEALGVELPVTVAAGSIGLLRVVVPWNTHPAVTLHVEHLTIVARPVGGDAAGASDLAARERRLARARLATDDAVREAARAVVDAANGGTGAGAQADANAQAQSGMVARFVSRVVENMAVEISDVVIRFEDAVSDPKRPYAVAVACDAIKALAADEHWQHAYIDDVRPPLARKIITLQGFRVGWSSLAAQRDPVASASASTSHSLLRAFVDDAAKEPDAGERPVIAPFGGVLRASIARGAASRASVEGPAVELDVDVPDVQLTLDDVQYASLLQTSVYFARLATRGLRPDSPRDRWRWAVEQLLPGFRERARQGRCLTPEGLQERGRQRHTYVATRTAVLQARRAGVAEPQNMSAELERMEEALRYEDVLLYRDLADEEVLKTPVNASGSSLKTAVDDQEKSAENESGGGYGSAIWRMLGYSTSADDDEEEVKEATATSTSEAAAGEHSIAASESGEGEDAGRRSNLSMSASEMNSFGMDASPTASDDQGLLSAQTSSSGTNSTSAPRAVLRAGFLLRKGTVRLSRGGYPADAEPMVELVAQDMRVGVTTTTGDGLLLEAVLGTVEAWDLQTNTAMVYPRVPWDPKMHPADVRDFQNVLPNTVAVDDTEQSVGGSGVNTPSRIPNSSYPQYVQSAIESIRSSVVLGQMGNELTSAHSLETNPQADANEESDTARGAFMSNRTENTHRKTLDEDIGRLQKTPDQVTGDPLNETRLTSDVNASPFQLGRVDDEESLDYDFSRYDEPSGKSLADESGTDVEFEALRYLIAIRVESSSSTSNVSPWRVEPSRVVMDVAVGRLEAVLDGPSCAFLWGLQFWQPKGTGKDPVVAFLGAAAGARIAEIRMEVKNALLSRKDPMHIDAVICAPRFVLPGRTGSSPAIVVNMGTFKFLSPAGQAGASQVRKAGHAAERYSTYELSLDDLSVYLAPCLAHGLSRKVVRDGQQSIGEESQEPTSARLPRRTRAERVIRPFSLKLLVSVLQDAQIVQAAHHGRGSSAELSRIAKLRVRGRIPGVRLVLSEKTWGDLIWAGKRWSSGKLGKVSHEFDVAVPIEMADADPMQGGIYDSLASLDTSMLVDTVSLELRGRDGGRILTFVASGTRAKFLKASAEEAFGDFRLESWTVTDGSRGTTAAFRKLAYAGTVPDEKGVSPPHSLSAASSYRSGSMEQDCFVSVQYRQNNSAGLRAVSVRFLALHMLCVRETYTKVASFFYGLSKELKAARLAERSNNADVLSDTEKRNANASTPEKSSDTLSKPVNPETRSAMPTAFSVNARLDGFSLRLVSAEGSLAAIEMRDFAIDVDRKADGGVSAGGAVGLVCIRDLTSPVDSHSEALLYKQRSPAVERMCEDVGDGNGVQHDGWSLIIPPTHESQSSPTFQAKCTGVRILFLARFATVVGRYLSLLRQGLQPAFQEVREAVDIRTSPLHGVQLVSPVAREGESNRMRSMGSIVFDVSAECLDIRLPRHSNCPQEALTLEVLKVRVSNFDKPLNGFGANLRSELSGVVGRVCYLSPSDNASCPSEKAPFLRCSTLEFRFDVFPSADSGVKEIEREVDGAQDLPSVRCRLLSDSSLCLDMCEAQYTVLYFVLTENLVETVDTVGTDFGSDGALETTAENISEVGDVASSDTMNTAEISVADEPSDVLAHLLFQLPALQLTIARGWRVTDESCHILTARLSNISGTVKLCSSRVSAEVASSIVDMVDVRPEAAADASTFMLPLEHDASSNGEKSDLPGSSTPAQESFSLMYEKPSGKKANISVVLNCVHVRVIPELFRDLSCVAIPGWPFLPSSELPPPVKYLGRSLSLTFSNSQVWSGAEIYPGDPRALLLRGELLARVLWRAGTGAKTLSLTTKGLSLALTYDRKQMVIEDPSSGAAREVALPVSVRDNLVLYPGDGSLEYVGPNVDESGRRVEILADFVLCRLNVKELPLVAAVVKRLGNVGESSLARRSWSQANPLAAASLEAVTSGRDTLSSSQAVATRKTLTLLMSTPAARVLFTDESNGRFVPILEGNMRNVVVQANLPRVFQVASEVSVNLFNESGGWWEPGLERWRVELSMSEGESGSRAFAITSNSNMDIDVTPSTISGALRVLGSLRSIGDGVLDDGGAVEDARKNAPPPSVAAFHVRNRLGQPVAIWLPHDPARVHLKDEDELKIDLPRDCLVPGVADSHTGDENLAREQALRCSISVTGYLPLELSAVDVGAHNLLMWQDDELNSSSSIDVSAGRSGATWSASSVSVVWDVSMEGGVPVCTLRSPSRVLNETASLLEVSLGDVARDGFFDSSDASADAVYLVPPGDSFCVPLNAIECAMRVRPIVVEPPDEALGYSEDIPAVRESGGDPGFQDDGDYVADEIHSSALGSGSHSIAREGISGGGQASEPDHHFDWSSPLPDATWLRATAAEVYRGGEGTTNSATPSILRALNPSSSSGRSQSRISVESVRCRSLRTHAPDFYVAVVPRSLFASGDPTSQQTPQWLDISLQAPLVLSNLLPGLLSYCVNPRNTGASALSDAVGSTVLGSGFLKPNSEVKIHSTDADFNNLSLSLAFENKCDVLGDTGLSDDISEVNGDYDPPTDFGPPASLSNLDGEKRGVCVEPSTSTSSLGVQNKKNRKELFVRVTPKEKGSQCLEVWSQFWVRNRSDTNLEFCGRPSFYASGTAVRPLSARPPGTQASKYVCFEGPYVSFRRAGPMEHNEPGGTNVQDWWTYQSDLRDVVKPVSVGVPGLSLVMEVRAGRGAFSNTMIVTVRNSSWVLNRTPTVLQWCQSSALDSHGNARMRDVHNLPVGESQPVHWDEKASSQALNLRLAEEDQEGFSGWFWSPPVPMDLGNKGEFPAKMYRPKSQEQYIARVVALKVHGGSSALVVYPEDRGNPPYRIVNLCRYRSIAFHQVGSEDRPWLVRPGKSTRYSWDDPLASTKRRELRVEVIESRASALQEPTLSRADSSRSREKQGSSVASRDVPSHTLRAGSVGDDFHHPKFNLNIDMVSQDAIEKRGTFDPPLYTRVIVDGATKVVTFQDTVETAQLLTESGRTDVSLRKSSFIDDVPTVVWDDLGDGVLETEQAAENPAVFGSNASNTDGPALEESSDYPATEALGTNNGSRHVSRDVDVNIFLASVGISLVDSTPVELAYLHAGGVFLKFERYEKSAQTTFDVTDLQIDNQLPNAAFPVLVWAPPLLSTQEDGQVIGTVPARTLAIEARRSSCDDNISMWKSIRGAVRPLDLAVDEELVIRLINFSEDVAKGTNDPQSEALSGSDGEHIPVLEQCDPGAESTSGPSSPGHESPGNTHSSLARIYVEDVKIFPLTIFLSSTASRGSLRSAGYKYSSLRTFVAILLNVHDCEFVFSPLELRHVFDSSQHFALLVKEYYLTQLNNQRMKLLTSNSLIGNPAALFDSVSIGARDLFVEPGRAKGSAEFLASVGKGSRSLLTHTVGGIVGSIGGIPKAMSSGLETAVGDRQYLAERERIRGHQLSGGLRPLAATPAQGVVTGAMSFAHGITSGVTGIFRDPMVGAKRGGAAGFIRGVGKGLVGGVVKPVAGAMDLIGEPAMGLSKSVVSPGSRRRGGAASVLPVRPPRTFTGSGMRLVPFDLRVATGRALLRAVQVASVLRVESDLIEWVELGDRPGRADSNACQFIWNLVRSVSHKGRGGRDLQSDTRAGDSSGPSSDRFDRSKLEKIQVALVFEDRIVVVTMDCNIVTDVRLNPEKNFEMRTENTTLVLESVRRGSVVGRAPEAADSRNTVFTHVWAKIQCGSVDACIALRDAVRRALLVLRQTTTRSPGRRPRSLVASRSAVELESLSGPSGSGFSVEPATSPAAVFAAADDRSGSLSKVGMPGRDVDGRIRPHDNLGNTPWSSGRSSVAERSDDTKQGSVVRAAVRRLRMGGTSRAIDSKRSLRVIIANALPYGNQVRLIRSTLDEGHWRIQPPVAVEPGDAKMCEADGGGKEDRQGRWQIDRDIRGSLLYGISPDPGAGQRGNRHDRVSQISLEFVNPVLSSASCECSSSPGLSVAYECDNGSHATFVFTFSANGGSEEMGVSSSLSSTPIPRVKAGLPGLPRPTMSKSSPNVSSSLSSLSIAGAAGAANAGRLFQVGSRRIRDAASSLGAGSGGPRLQGSRSSSGGPSRTEAAPQRRTSSSSGGATLDPEISVALSQLIELGFERDPALAAILETNGDLVSAVDLLTQ